MRSIVIEGRTFMVDKQNVIDEVDNEDCHGDLVQELCLDDTSLRVDYVVTSIALNFKYIKKRYSGFRKTGDLTEITFETHFSPCHQEPFGG